MPIVYLFLYVFSLSVPLFYHSAFLVGAMTTVHLLIKKRHEITPTLSSYQFGYVGFFLLGYVWVAATVVIHGTYDFSFFKTYTNALLSACCAIPLAKLYRCAYHDECVDVWMRHMVTIFWLQSVIIIVVIMFPVLKPMVAAFQRNAEMAEDIDVFSSGIRTNALSGGLFFGLSLSFSFALLCYLYRQFVLNKRYSLRSVLGFIIINIGLACTGRFGFIYLCSAAVIFLSSGWYKKLRRLAFFLLFLSAVGAFFYGVYHQIDAIREKVDNKIYPYFFEVFHVYLETGKMETASTNELMAMYDIRVPLDTWLLGDGRYTGNDGLYYLHSDVGYIRLLLLGGAPLLAFMVVFFFFSLWPLTRIMPSGQTFFWAVASLFAIAQCKGEAMITSVSINNTIFLLCSLITLSRKK